MRTDMRAKSFLKGSLLAFLLIATLYFFSVDQLAIPTRTLDRYYKQFLLKASRGEAKKIIIDGGSNAVHGINSLQIERYFGRLTLNLADNGEYPLAHKLSRLGPMLDRGDLVLLPLEWNHYVLGNTYPGNYVLPMLDKLGSNAFYYKALPLWQRVGFVYQQIPYALAAKRALELNALVSRNIELQHNEHTKYSSFYYSLGLNMRGDYSGSKPHDIGIAGSALTSCDKVVLEHQVATGFTIAEEFSENLRNMRVIANKTGANFVFTWPNVVDYWADDCYRSDEVVEHLDKYAAAITLEVEKYGFAFIGDYEDSRFDKSCFWDTYYHITRECATLRTDRLITAMARHGIARSGDYDLENIHKIQFTYFDSLRAVIDGIKLPRNTPILAGQNSPNVNYAGGWSGVESWGRWSVAKESTVLIPGVDNSLLTLRVTGRYYQGAEATEVWINQQYMGAHRLEDYSFDLAGVPLDEGMLDIRFLHGNPVAPASLGNSNDTRTIKYGIESITLIDADD